MADSRFYAGYTWVSETPDCKRGLCMPSLDRQVAAQMFWRKDAEQYHNREKTRIAYTMQSADEQPVMHEVVL